MSSLAVDCKTKALRSFDLSGDDDLVINRRRIELPEKGMESLKRGKSWRPGWSGERNVSYHSGEERKA
jgi:hypothetical protein